MSTPFIRNVSSLNGLQGVILHRRYGSEKGTLGTRVKPDRKEVDNGCQEPSFRSPVPRPGVGVIRETCM